MVKILECHLISGNFSTLLFSNIILACSPALTLYECCPLFNCTVACATVFKCRGDWRPTYIAENVLLLLLAIIWVSFFSTMLYLLYYVQEKISWTQILAKSNISNRWVLGLKPVDSLFKACRNKTSNAFLTSA